MEGSRAERWPLDPKKASPVSYGNVAGGPLSTSVQGAGANASCVWASFCVVTQPTRVLQCAEWLHAPDPCCTRQPVRVLGSGRWRRCVRVVRGHVCQRVHAGPWGLPACVCTPRRVRVRGPVPRPATSVCVNCHVDFVLSFRITISDP